MCAGAPRPNRRSSASPAQRERCMRGIRSHTADGRGPKPTCVLTSPGVRVALRTSGPRWPNRWPMLVLRRFNSSGPPHHAPPLAELTLEISAICSSFSMILGERKIRVRVRVGTSNSIGLENLRSR